jgi:hypothetical protein
VFWQALLVTILIFAVGLVLGIMLENWRAGKVESLYERSEIDLLDVRLQSEIYAQGNFSCETAVKSNIEFADRIFEEAKVLDRYEQASRLRTEDLALWHKKYDLLRTILFMNSLKIKEKCDVEYNNVVYLYSYADPDIDKKVKQNVFSRVLGELKKEKGNDILLIPIAGNNNLTAVDLLLEKYDIKEEDLPVILIDEKIKIRELQTVEQLGKYFE